MNNYVDKIHEIIERVNPQLYVDVRYAHQVEWYKLLFLGFLIGFGLWLIAWLLSKFTKIEGDWIVRVGSWVNMYSVFMLLVVMSAHKSEVHDTLNSTSKSTISEYIGTLNNDEYIDMEKNIRAYSNQVSLDSELDRAVNNYLMEILDK
jgi:hypothetical protein